MIWFFSAIAVSFFSYINILNGFFQQDEWYGFSEFALRIGSSFGDLLKYIFAPSVVHFTPFTLAFLEAFLSAFGMNYQLAAIFSIAENLIVVILVYVLLKQIFKDRVSAGIGALIFASFASGYQATAWVMADVATHGATIFGIISIIQFLKYLERGVKNHFIFSLIALLVSIMFKEITLGLFLVMLFLAWSYGKRSKKERWSISKVVVIFGILYVVGRMVMIPFVTLKPGSMLIVQSQSYPKLIYNTLVIPIKAIIQTFVPLTILLGISRQVATVFPVNVRSLMGTTEFEVFVLKRVFETISLSASLIIAALIILKRNKQKAAFLGLFWIIANSLIFSLASERSGAIFVIDSRYLYFPGIGAAILFTDILKNYLTKNKIVFWFLLLTILIPNIYYLNSDINLITERGELRNKILVHIRDIYPDLPDKTVFYVRSNQPYYGLPETLKIPPFQSGFGQTLLVWYYPIEKFPKEFFQNRFLWEIDSQGYKEAGNRGFGYFREEDLLKQAVKEYDIPMDSVFAFDWNGNMNILSDITKEVRHDLYDGKN